MAPLLSDVLKGTGGATSKCYHYSYPHREQTCYDDDDEDLPSVAVVTEAVTMVTVSVYSVVIPDAAKL